MNALRSALPLTGVISSGMRRESTMGCMPTRDEITEALRSVIDPELHKDIVTLEMVRSIDVHANGVVDVTVSLTTPGCPIRDHFQNGVDAAIRALDGVTGVNISFNDTANTEKQS